MTTQMHREVVHPSSRSVAELTVVVVTFNSSNLLLECLDALPAAMSGIRSYRVLVVDNASQDDTTTIASSRPGVEVVRNSANLGYAAAVNIGSARAAPTGPVLLLNPDVRLAPGSVGPLVRALQPGRIGITVPVLLDREGNLVHSLRRDPTVPRALAEALLGGQRASRIFRLGEVVRDPLAYEMPTSAAWATGCAFLVSAECREVVGAWDDRFFLYSEETDFALRSRDAGLDLLLVPEARATHIGGESRTSPTLWALLTRNRFELYRSRHGAVASAAFRSAVVLNEAVRAARGSAVHKAGLRAITRRWSPETRLAAAGEGPESSPACIAVLGSGRLVRSEPALTSRLRSMCGRRRLLVVVGGRGDTGRTVGLRRPDRRLPGLWVFRPFGGSARATAWQTRLTARCLGFGPGTVAVGLDHVGEAVAGRLGHELAGEDEAARCAGALGLQPEGDA